MNRIPVVIVILVSAVSFIATPCFAEVQAAKGPAETMEQKRETTPGDNMGITLNFPLDSPLFSCCPIAEVNDEPITVEDLTEMLMSSHENRETQPLKKTKMSYAEPLRRLISIRLIVQEARNIGLDDLPEVKGLIDQFAQEILINLLLQEAVKDITVDEKEVEPVYLELVREWKLKSLLFDQEKNAKKAVAALKTGQSFEEIARAALKEGTAKGSEQGEYVQAASLSPVVQNAVSKLKIGSVSPILRVDSGKMAGYTLVKLEDVRFPDNPAARKEASKQAFLRKNAQTKQKYRDSLYKKYVKLDKKLFASIDYEAKKPGFNALLEDKRVLAKIVGEEPVRVKDLTQAIKNKLFHGVQGAIEEKKINAIKQEVLDKIIDKKVYRKEALLKGIDRTPQYQKLLRNREAGILFGSFIQKVIAPTVKYNDDDLKNYYDEHISEYSYPAMVKLSGLPFNQLHDAEAAFDKLKKGADYTWIKANAQGLTAAGAEDLMTFGDNFITIKNLPADMQKALTGAKPGDFRIAAGTDGRSYILSVLEVIPSRQQSIEEVASPIAEKVFSIKFERAVERWAEQLKQAAEVKVYIKQ